jgi:lactam utilization protein B
MAFEGCYRHVGELLSQWNQALRNINKMVKNARVAALRSQLTALDRQSMVILGDPTACLPPLPS